MKAILKFNLDDHDQEMEHKRCIKATDMAIVIFEFIYNTRKDLEETNATLDQTLEAFNRLLDEYNINIDELLE